MKHIFNQAKDVCVWLGEEDENERMHKLFEYADRLRRSDDSVRTRELDCILTPRQLLIAIRKLLDRPWFSRVWVRDHPRSLWSTPLIDTTSRSSQRSHWPEPRLLRAVRAVSHGIIWFASSAKRKPQTVRCSISRATYWAIQGSASLSSPKWLGCIDEA